MSLETQTCQVPGCNEPTLKGGSDAVRVGLNITYMVCWGCAARWYHVNQLLAARDARWAEQGHVGAQIREEVKQT